VTSEHVGYLLHNKIDSSNLIESSSLYLADSKEEELNQAVKMILNSSGGTF